VRFDVILQGFVIALDAFIPAKAGTQARCASVRGHQAFMTRDSLGPGFRRDDGGEGRP